MGRHRMYPHLAAMPSAEYQPFARKLRAYQEDEVTTQWRLAYGLCYRRGVPRPTLAQFRTGTFPMPALRTPEQVAESARQARLKVVARHRALLAA